MPKKSDMYYDSRAAMQVIGCALLSPSLLEEDGRYFYSPSDFAIKLHKVVFGAAYELHSMGVEKLTLKDIDGWFENKPEERGVYMAAQGAEYVKSLIDAAELSNFDYYYGRLKKMSLLRGYAEAGVDVSWFYDPTELVDVAKKAAQDRLLDEKSLSDISDLVDNKILTIREERVDNISGESVSIGTGLRETLMSLSETPEVGCPFSDEIFTAITRGARLGKYYLRSAPTGIGNMWSKLNK